MQLLTQNSKMRKTSKKTGTRIFNFSLPAIITCPNAGACKQGCYANAGGYRFKQAKHANRLRLAATKQPNFVYRMNAEIARVKPTHVRIHDSGDFYCLKYLLVWMDIISLNPNVIFYAYTKEVVNFDAVIRPANFVIIYSYGGKQDSYICKRDRHAKVFKSVEDLETAGYANAMENDLVALGPNHKIGLVYHGTKKYENTNWKEVR